MARVAKDYNNYVNNVWDLFYLIKHCLKLIQQCVQKQSIRSTFRLECDQMVNAVTVALHTFHNLVYRLIVNKCKHQSYI